MLYSVTVAAIPRLLPALARFEVHGADLVPPEGPLIVVANHLHFADPFILGSALPRKVAFMGKAELFRNAALALILRALGAFPVRRGEGDLGAIRRAIEIVDSGRALGMFPEGRRSPDGLLQRGRRGPALVALRTRATILPVGLSGTGSWLHRPGLLARGRVTVNIGQPFRPESSEAASRQQQVELTEQIMARIASLLPPGHRPGA